MPKDIRHQAAAGGFYPADKQALATKIEQYLAAAPKVEDGDKVKMILVPHAGYDYSGPVAAYSYKALAGRKIKTVILIGSSHTSYFDGAAVDDHDVWQTPLGNVEVDRSLGQKLAAAGKNIKINSAVHEEDHILEVQLPFLQTVLAGNFKILPIVLGNTSDERDKNLAEALEGVIGEDDLIVLSSDMSHYPSYENAGRIDKKTLELIAQGDVDQLDNYVVKTMQTVVPNEETLLCGLQAVKTGMRIADKLGWQSEILKYANSGDAPIGDKDAVVGYGAIIYKLKIKDEKLKIDLRENALNKKQQETLLEIARETVEMYVETGKVKDFTISDERLKRPEGVFVTLEKNGQLRGCIGQIISTGAPLWENVRDMAIAACSEDNRFEPVSEEELPELAYEISVLSKPEEIDDWQKIKLGEHGVIVSRGWNKGVFLPQVAVETGWDLKEFLAHLCAEKAGLPPDCYKNDPQVKLQIFTAQVFSGAG